MSCLDVWVAAFDRLSDALEDYVACCQSINEAPPAAEEITGVDDSTGAPEYDRGEDERPTEFADQAAYDAYLCGVAHRMAERMDGAVDTAYDVILTTSNILVFATLVVLAFANVIGMGIAAVLAGGYTLVSLGEVFGFFSAMTELREALGGGDPQGLVPQTKSELSAASDDIVDAIFCANDAPAATAALHDVFDAAVTSGSYRAILKLMFNGLVMRAAFAGFVNVQDRFDCTCAPTGMFVSNFTLVNGNFYIWDGSQYVDANWGASPHQGTVGEVMRVKGAGDDRLTMAASFDQSGSPREFYDVTIDLVNVTNNVLVQTFQGSGSAVHNQTHAPGAFPMSFSGIDGLRLEAAQIAIDVDPSTRWATLQITAVG